MGQSGHVLVTPTAWGHVQYVKSDRAGAALAHLHRVSLLAAVDFHILSLVDSYMKMFPSAFPDSATYRSFSGRGPHGGGFRHGFEQWFWGVRAHLPAAATRGDDVRMVQRARRRECFARDLGRLEDTVKPVPACRGWLEAEEAPRVISRCLFCAV